MRGWVENHGRVPSELIDHCIPPQNGKDGCKVEIYNVLYIYIYEMVDGDKYEVIYMIANSERCEGWGEKGVGVRLVSRWKQKMPSFSRSFQLRFP